LEIVGQNTHRHIGHESSSSEMAKTLQEGEEYGKGGALQLTTAGRAAP
jgi:hypothetical protein